MTECDSIVGAGVNPSCQLQSRPNLIVTKETKKYEQVSIKQASTHPSLQLAQELAQDTDTCVSLQLA